MQETSWKSLPPNAFSEPPQDLTLIHEARRHQKRMLWLGGLAAVPGVVLLIGLLIWGISTLNQSRQKQLVITAYKKGVTEYLEMARKAVAAWPDDGQTLVRIQSEMLPAWKSLPPLPEGKKWEEFKDALREMSICLIKPVMFIEHENIADAPAVPAAESMRASHKNMERQLANNDIRTARAMIERLEKGLDK